MKRTKGRSVASGRVSRSQAAIFGAVAGAIGFGVLYHYTTPLAAWVALAGHFYYVVLYTMLPKKRTPQNIVIGGGAGAVGPLIGAAAATGSLTVSAWLLFWLIFLWTPPHFWALALKYQKDYASAGIPMCQLFMAITRLAGQFMYTLTLIPIALFLSFSEELVLHL